MPALVILSSFPVALLIALGINWLGLRAWRTVKDAHWTEGARKLFPIRRSASLNTWLIPTVWGLTLLLTFPQAQQPGLLASAVVLGWVGVVTGTYPLDKEIFPQFRFAQWFRYVCTMRVLRFGTPVLLVAAAVVMPEQFGWTSILLGCAV